MEPLRVTGRLTIPPDELRVAFSRSGGPGGQNVNKVETQVELRFDVRGSTVLGDDRRARIEEVLGSRLTTRGELIVRCSTHRERGRNIEEARSRLAALLQGALAQDRPRKATRPTRGSQVRRLDSKKRRSEIKRRRRDSGD